MKTAVAPFESSVEHKYSKTPIPEINKMGLAALKECVVLELQGRELWDDPEVRWSLDFATELHEGEMRKDGPYLGHIYRVTLWTLRNFDLYSAEAAKAALLHDSIENHPSKIITNLNPPTIQLPETTRINAHRVLAESGKLREQNTIGAIGRLTCPSYKNHKPIAKRKGYAHHVVDIILPDPLATVVKEADQIENSNGNKYCPDISFQRRLDLKYFPLSEVFIDAVYLDDSLIPDHRKDAVADAFRNGHEEARLRLMQSHPDIGLPGLTLEEIDELTLENLFQMEDVAA